MSLNKKPLVNRINYVLTRNKDFKINLDNVFVIHDILDILELNQTSDKDIYIIGGKKVYEVFFKYAQQLIISKLNQDYQCDLLLNYNLNGFKLLQTINHDTFKTEIYERIK
ncbi:dihydrofolate reductase [bacterium]|nr:dihydrofolate reductase [bacterium]MBO6073168.1 dihydrofolate reductase [bacterium]